MEPLIFFVDVVEDNVEQQDQIKIYVRALKNPLYTGTGAVSYVVKFDLETDTGPINLTPAAGSSPTTITTAGTKKYFFDTTNAAPWTLGSHTIVVTIPAPTGAENLANPPEVDIMVQEQKPAATVVTLAQNLPYDTEDEELWRAIKASQIQFRPMFDFVSEVLCEPGVVGPNSTLSQRLPFVQTGEYSVLKFAIEAYMMAMVSPGAQLDLGSYLVTNQNLANSKILPYYDLILQKLNEIKFNADDLANSACLQRLVNKASTFSLFELIWSYWQEEGMLVQTMNSISLRFQNMGKSSNLNPLFRLDTASLLPMSNLLWGYIQDEQHSLSMYRRVYEYDHAYGLTMKGKAVPQMKAVDTRSKFLEAFHNLLHKSAIHYRESDDNTRNPDALPVLNALREVHILLAEGFHNAYVNLTWTARHEMLVQQYLLAQPEMQQFLGGRPMVPYAEPWMDKVDTVRGMMGWGDTSISHFWDLATFGEVILLSVRFGNWSVVIDPIQARGWAVAFRNEIMRYIHAYRAVTGVDLSADTVGLRDEHFAQPAKLIHLRVNRAKGTGGRVLNGVRQQTEFAYN